ncbi:hypothetical protein PXK00_07900 [Phaeobacter sp. QD34_3]|nr:MULTISPECIES: hypothetical protein [unclassified Phaeobacter]MDE4133030.1 hypothetical protein [Phaeobacter sp. QD34_3]MDE4136568.1 hypothetical protein [Phaeobacter sp. QD34_24]
MTLRPVTPRIGAAKYRAGIESDVNAALRLLETVAGHLANAEGTARRPGV